MRVINLLEEDQFYKRVLLVLREHGPSHPEEVAKILRQTDCAVCVALLRGMAEQTIVPQVRGGSILFQLSPSLQRANPAPPTPEDTPPCGSLGTPVCTIAGWSWDLGGRSWRARSCASRSSAA